MNYLRAVWSMYRPGFATVLVYMLQNTEYQVRPYVEWLNRTKNFSGVVKRRELVRTRPARLLLLSLRTGMLCQFLAGLALIVLGLATGLGVGVPLGLAVIVLVPYVWAYGAALPIALGRLFVAGPKERALIAESEKLFADHPGVKIAIAGSYGKTTMKELLATVLSEGKKVAATPANLNVAVSHARFARTLSGDEDIVIIEYGEGEPGDVARFARTTHPTHGIITGLAPAHLDHYPSLEAAGRDIFGLADYLKGKQVYVNDEAAAIKPFLRSGYETYDRSGALGWQVEGVELDLSGLRFALVKGKESLRLHSGLLGRHQLANLAFVAAFALKLGLGKEQVTAGIAKTLPFEHRMQPRELGGAWIIDDTYNGNIEGIRAGTELLAELPAKRKIYVTPGLVDQGVETKAVHVQMGKLIAKARPDVVVLMENSVTPDIQAGLAEGGYQGETLVQKDPLQFYTNLEHFVAAGDLVLMQNDWTDNYA